MAGGWVGRMLAPSPRLAQLSAAPPLAAREALHTHRWRGAAAKPSPQVAPLPCEEFRKKSSKSCTLKASWLTALRRQSTSACHANERGHPFSISMHALLLK